MVEHISKCNYYKCLFYFYILTKPFKQFNYYYYLQQNQTGFEMKKSHFVKGTGCFAREHRFVANIGQFCSSFLYLQPSIWCYTITRYSKDMKRVYPTLLLHINMTHSVMIMTRVKRQEFLPGLIDVCGRETSYLALKSRRGMQESYVFITELS